MSEKLTASYWRERIERSHFDLAPPGIGEHELKRYAVEFIRALAETHRTDENPKPADYFMDDHDDYVMCARVLVEALDRETK